MFTQTMIMRSDVWNDQSQTEREKKRKKDKKNWGRERRERKNNIKL